MKKLWGVFPIFFCLAVHAQTKSDSVNEVQQWARWYDLDFTNSEADSMLDNLVFWKQTYVKMHQRLPKNDLPFPFAFKPAPSGYRIPVNQQKINWPIPSNVSVPANKNDLAF